MADHNLIPIFTATINGASTNAVDARLLHTFLEIRQKFADWIVSRIDEYGFSQGIDFLIILDFQKNPGGRPLKEYHCTIDMAKELAMVERNQKGREVRQYFIECEQRLREPRGVALPDFTKPAEAARAWAEQYERAEAERLDKQKAQEQIEADRPKVEFHDEVAKQGEEVTIREAVKVIFNRAITERRLVDWLFNQKWLCKTGKGREPTAYAIDRGFMRCRFDFISHIRQTVLVAVFTGKGIAYLRHLYRTGELFTGDIERVRLLPMPEDEI